ncbi:RidA family protein [Bacillus vallismortis]|uniref:RidA family protein n=1 Tax=Bacillus vallismortis TaxID=72361 RepID=UPI002DBEB864|nr:RidA family protein [Bacillus vallismortis]MEC1650025.1 RidA family protein [Bacillus vallismortis]
MESIFEAGNLKSNGHYALAVIHQNTVYVSGQFAIDPITQEKKFGTIEEETLQALSNIERILEEAGSNKGRILKLTLYLHDINLLDRVDNVCQGFFADFRPVCSIVPTNELHYGFQIEIEAIASL